MLKIQVSYGLASIKLPAPSVPNHVSIKYICDSFSDQFKNKISVILSAFPGRTLNLVQADYLYKRTICTSGLSVQADYLYKRTICTSGLSVQADYLYKRTICTSGLSVQADYLYKRTICTSGLSVQVDYLYKWTICTSGLSVQADSLQINYLLAFYTCHS